jgi:predicted DsbA family dithiol-disulfide isomerase
MFDEAGLPHAERTRMPNSRAALNVAELARTSGVHAQVHKRLMTAFWAEDRDISDPAVLAEEGANLGLDRAEIVEAATAHPFQPMIEASSAAVYDMGAGGVPAFAVDDKLLIPGAQPHSLFEKVMDRLGHKGLPPG